MMDTIESIVNNKVEKLKVIWIGTMGSVADANEFRQEWLVRSCRSTKPAL